MNVDAHLVAELLADKLSKDPTLRQQIVDRVVREMKFTQDQAIEVRIRDELSKLLHAKIEATPNAWQKVEARLADSVTDKHIHEVLLRLISQTIGKELQRRVQAALSAIARPEE